MHSVSDFKRRALILSDLFSQYADIINREILDFYPGNSHPYDPEWLNFLKSLDLDDLYFFETSQSTKELQKTFPQLPKSLSALLQKLEEACVLNSSIDADKVLPKLEDWAFIKVKHKKKYEIERILPTILALKDRHAIEQLLDIGGGLGHLARITSHYYALESHVIECNEHFVALGLERSKKFRTIPGAKEIYFHHQLFSLDHPLPNKLKAERLLVLGLHACGELSIDLIKTAINLQAGAIFNFGCCYHKGFQEEHPYHCTFFKSENLFPLHLFARTLASRAHYDRDREQFLTKRKVKKYRYALHLYLAQHKSYFIQNVGEVNVKEYQKSFADYALGRIQFLQLIPNDQKKENEKVKLQDFYDDPNIQNTIHEMFVLNQLRFRFGRALEIYLLIDRALYAFEQGRKVKMETYFDDQISPRNIGLVIT